MSNRSRTLLVDKRDLRKLMSEKKSFTASRNENKIESRFAKYNAVGQLWCTLCNCPVKTNLLWNSHVQGRTHRENVTEMTANAESLEAVHMHAKRKASDDQSDVKQKYLKASAAADEAEDERVGRDHTVSGGDIQLPSDFFDAEVESEAATSTHVIAEQLPEGFFDDPKLDAKVRQVPYRDKMDDEWELFQKSMKEETVISEAIVEEDDELREEERNIEEIDDQLCRLARVTTLVKKKEQLSCNTANSQQAIVAEDASDADADAQELEEFLDWRIKKAWK